MSKVVYQLSQLSNCLTTSTAQLVNGFKASKVSHRRKSSFKPVTITCNESFDEAVKNLKSEMILYITKPNLRWCRLGNKLMGAQTSIYLSESKKSTQLRLPIFQKTKHATWDVSPLFGASKGLHHLPSSKISNLVCILSSKNGLLHINNHTFQVRGFKTERMVEKEKEKWLGAFYQKRKANPEIGEHYLEKFDPKSVAEFISIYQQIEKKISTRWYTRVSWMFGGSILATILLAYVFFTRFNGNRFNAFNSEEVNVTFDDFRGCEQVKNELKTVVNSLKNPKTFSQLGARAPKGVLMVGEPGVGKTLLARAIAGEAGVPFFFVAGSEFDETFVGMGSKRIRELFRVARENAPCVVFFDEIDTVGRKRVNSHFHPYANQTINQLLSEMDGFEVNSGVMVLAATNRDDDLDPALMRPGRFDMTIKVPVPSSSERRDIIEYYLQKVACRNIDIDQVVRLTSDWNGARLENLINWAAINAAVENAEYVGMHHIFEAFDRLVLGVAWGSSSEIMASDMRITAYHEAGHTLVAILTPGTNAVHKVTIEPRGPALGHTTFLEGNARHKTKAEYKAEMDICFGGTVAEELLYGTDGVSSGCASDINVATKLAKMMVKSFGMETNSRVINEEEKLGEAAQSVVDSDIDILLKESKERARKLLSTHADDLHKLAGALIKYKTLSATEVMQVLGKNDDVKSLAE
ncbi:ATP-dependent zinc metalloprotease YME1L isoform X2 [Thrips palmi]|uniref:ATP-dependent zinc metalloprotease YME1L isoform X2 n=1 Tax=Thrips palmi TaxID=161013 RepID=A0A6P9AHU2_THRPL|nr:ATP-dependent zinc metalloprotease YME1L isoform X2 [Thrips palmi]